MSRGPVASQGLEAKQRQFNAAMESYEKKSKYKAAGKIVSLATIALQAVLVYQVLPLSLGWPRQILAFFLAYIATDFINGLVHMYMDNNDSYASPAGPLIAAFHLHHKTPPYKHRNILLVYFNETGSKIWLAAVLAAGAGLVHTGAIPPVMAYILMYFGVLSSAAELAHYRCHIPESKFTRFWGRIGVLISKRHHARHHLEDNRNYAFLSGWSDPVLNVIARKVYPGYKNSTDRHFALYAGPGTENRE